MFHFDRRRLCFSRPSVGILLFTPAITILAAIETAWATFDLIRVHGTAGSFYRFCGVVAIIAMWTLVIGAPVGFIGVAIRSRKISTAWWHLATWHAVFTTVGGVIKTIALLANRSGWLNLCNAEHQYLFDGMISCKRYWRIRMLGHVIVYFGLCSLLIMSAMLLTGFVAELAKSDEGHQEFIVVDNSRRGDNIGLTRTCAGGGADSRARFVAPHLPRPAPQRADSARSEDAPVTADQVIEGLPSGTFTEIPLSEKKIVDSRSSSFSPDTNPFADKAFDQECLPPPAFEAIHPTHAAGAKAAAAENAKVQVPETAHLPDTKLDG
ncbi:hypothetical protein IE81DRAFT_251146 [Ceraceosorus guamensis]|uniref:Uncharacterized protein n=1 Tax=Ceraceosorus guamensis TaxID=1522189 RepID=A0A316W4I5_9BASI|nr:hypothetical protein IE81DRAFT_251146 [Ceraceosorus guamensis]PWN44659.1 hypothetical protein IE81DRAFT_251146 [Ceraceosorus guamensis]